MKLDRTFIIFDQGGISSSESWKNAHASYARAISSMTHPKGASSMTLRRMVKEKNGKEYRNGVPELRRLFLDRLKFGEGWESEVQTDIERDQKPALVTKYYPIPEEYEEPITANFGGFDFVAREDDIRIAIEWETGNISSSHRSLNKLSIALQEGKIQAGVLIVPSRALYKHLTDRVGNIHELTPYLSFWKSYAHLVQKGLLAISVVEHDDLTDDPKIPYLKLGKDGNAKKQPPENNHSSEKRSQLHDSASEGSIL